MADEPEQYSWRATCLGCAGVSVILMGIVFLAIAVEQRGFDPHRLCNEVGSGECLSTETGVVQPGGAGLFEDIRVAYDDGTKTVDVFIDEQETPAAGTRVVLEWWDGDVVAVVDRESGRRYETGDWPDPWWDWLAGFGALAAVAGTAVAIVFGVVSGLQRLLRRRQAARSNGKPWRWRRRSKSRR
jgi:hypothetical protein